MYGFEAFVRKIRSVCFAVLVAPAVALFLCPTHGAEAQAVAAGTRGFDLSAFAGLTGNYTGLAGGRNLDLTAGADLGFKPIYSFYPSLEVRGSYPVDGGKVDSQKNVLAGVKIARYYGRFHPYVDGLVGRGAINYEQHFATPDPNFYYVRSASNVLAAGGGIDLALSTHLLLRADGQFERYASPAVRSGRIYSKPLTAGVVYRFTFGR